MNRPPSEVPAHALQAVPPLTSSSVFSPLAAYLRTGELRQGKPVARWGAKLRASWRRHQGYRKEAPSHEDPIILAAVRRENFVRRKRVLRDASTHPQANFRMSSCKQRSPCSKPKKWPLRAVMLQMVQSGHTFRAIFLCTLRAIFPKFVSEDVRDCIDQV